MSAPLEFRLLGPVEALADSVPLDIGGPKQRALLALLLLRANEVVPRERLIDELWGDVPPPAARDTVRVYIGRLRKILDSNGVPEHLVTHRGGYQLNIELDQLDLNRFEQLAESGSRALAADDAQTASAVLTEALSLWHGKPLVDLGEVPFAGVEQGRLEELQLSALEQRIEADLALGRAAELVPELQRLTREHPYRERLHRQLMLALYRSGRQAEALEAYRHARSALAEELGIEPSPALKELEKAILAQDAALEVPVSGSGEAKRGTVPARHRWRFVVAGAVLLALAGTTIAALLLRDATTVKVSPNSVAVIDPAANKLVKDIPVGRRPNVVAAAGGHVWVGNSQDGTLTKIDPHGQPSTIPLDGPSAALIASKNVAWVVTAGSRLELARYDWRFDEPTRRAAIAPGFSPSKAGTAVWGSALGGTPLAVGSRTIWTLGGLDGSLMRLDPTTLAPRGKVSLSDLATSIAANKDAAWVTTKSSGLVHVDPDTNRMVEPSFATSAVDVAVGGHAVWLASEDDDLVIRLNPTTGKETPIRVGNGPTAVAYGLGSVWVACKGDGTVWRIDPETTKILREWKLGASPADIAAGAGAVWIAVYSPLTH